MIVKVAKNAGFCGGVNRAFVMVKKKFKNSKSKPRVLILGSLVHNENVAAVIGGWGIKKINTLRSIKKDDIVIITAHGVSKERIQKIKDKGATVFDVTCPNVSRVHRSVSEYVKKGYDIVIFGDRKHKEVKGINGWCKNKAKIIENEKEMKSLAKTIARSKKNKPILVVSQTTQSITLFDIAAKMITKAGSQAKRKVKIINTICDATLLRQREAKEFAKNYDGIVVVGGKKSANTRQLWKIAKNQNKNVFWIEELNMMAKNKIKTAFKNAKKVGVLSGASTPHWDIDETVNFLKSL